MMEKRTGTKLVKAFPKGERCVSMIEFNGKLFVATDKHIYRLKGDRLYKVNIVQAVVQGEEAN